VIVQFFYNLNPDCAQSGAALLFKFLLFFISGLERFICKSIHSLLSMSHSHSTVKDKGPECVKEIKKLVLIGASNLARTSKVLQDMGFAVAERRVGVGLLRSAEVEEVSRKISKLDSRDTGVVFDLHGNLAYIFSQVDGSTALPVNLGGKYHLLGDIMTADDKTLQCMIERRKGLLKRETNLATHVLPPCQDTSAVGVARHRATPPT